MEDLYDFLNLKSTSTESEIYIAYIVKSIDLEENVHLLPEEQKKQMALLKKAHDVLLNLEDRKNYDDISEWRKRKLNSMLYLVSDEKPAILQFTTSKQQVKIGDEIIITWKTTGCDQIILIPFGLVLNVGQKKITISNEDGLNQNLVLIVKNTVKGLKQQSSIQLKSQIKSEEVLSNMAFENAETRAKKNITGIVANIKQIFRNLFG